MHTIDPSAGRVLLVLALCVASCIANRVHAQDEPPAEVVTSQTANDGPAEDGATSDSPTNEGPTNDGPTSDGPTSDGPTSDGPTSDGPTDDGPTSDGPTSDGPTNDGPADDRSTSDDHSSDPAAGEAPEIQRAGPMRSEDAEVYNTTEASSGAAGALGTATLLSGVLTASMLGYFLDRTGQVDTCAAAEAAESERGCVNRDLIEGQRDTALGLFIGSAALLGVLATSWAIVAVSDSDEAAEEASVRCAPSLLGVVCAGQF